MTDKDQKEDKTSEAPFFKELKAYVIKALIGLGALGTIFPLIANKLNETFKIHLEWAFHMVYTFYFLVPVTIILAWVLRKKIRSKLANNSPIKKIPKLSSWYVFVNLGIMLLSGLLFFGLGAPPWTFFIPLFLGVSLSAVYQFILSFDRACWGARSERRTAASCYALISLLILLPGGLLIANRGNLNENILEKNNVYIKLEKQKDGWRNIEGELKKIKLLVTRRTLNQKEKIVGKIQYEIKKKDIPELLRNEIKNLKKEILVDEKTIDLSPKTFKLLEEILLTVKSIKEENERKQLKIIFDKVFYRGLLFLISILILLTNLLLFFRYEEINYGKGTFNNETASIKNYIAIIVFLIIPIFPTVDSKNVNLDHPIWPVSLQYIATGGDRCFVCSTRNYPTHYTDRSINLEGSDLDLTEVRELLRVINECTAKTKENVLYNTKKLTNVEANTEMIRETTGETLGKVKKNLAKTNEVENK